MVKKSKGESQENELTKVIIILPVLLINIFS